MNNFRPVSLAAILVLLVIGSVAAMSVIPRDFHQLVARAETIFKGTVAQQQCVWKGEGDTRRIITLVTFRVQETYKGEAVVTQVIELLGGMVDNEGMEIPGMPKFSIGETYVLFVVNNGRQICPLVGAYQGQFRVEKDQGIGEERIYTHDRKPIHDTADLGKIGTSRDPHSVSAQEAPLKAITTREFRDRIMQKAREQAAHPSTLPSDD